MSDQHQADGPIPPTAAIIAAGGIGSRLGLDVPKQFCELDSRPILAHTLLAMQNCPAISLIIVVAPPDFIELTKKITVDYKISKVMDVVPGGKLRHDSVKAGLAVIPGHIEYAAVHDGARPFVTCRLITSCIAAAREEGAALAAIPAADTMKEVDDSGMVVRTMDRRKIWLAQTPQVARVSLLRQAFAVAEKNNFIGTDEASFLEYIKAPVKIVNGSEKNIKITRPDDLPFARALLYEK